MAPLAAALDLPVNIDGRVIEAGNELEGRLVTPVNLLKGGPKTWWMFRNILKPTWGEAYTDIVARMKLVLKDAADAAAGHEAVVVSHQLPIWMARCDAEGRRLAHDPRKRECTLASITSFTFLTDGPVEFGGLPGAGCRSAEADQSEKSTKFVAGA